MRKLFLLLLLVLAGCSMSNPSLPKYSAQATTPGYDVLGLPKYCDTFLKAPSLPAVSLLMTSFGNPLPCLERLLKKGQTQVVQVDIRDATCFRNHVCPPGTPPLTDWNVLAAQTRKVAAIAAKYPDVQWDISPWLEHDIKDQTTVRKACDVITNNCPGCRCVNSPFTGARPAEIPIEVHGTKVKAFSVSGDGASLFDGDNLSNDSNNFQHRLSGSYTTYGWHNSFNLRCQGEDNFTPIPARTARPPLWQFESMHKIMTSTEDAYPPAPKVCRTVVRVNGSRGEINKPLAEKYCNGQSNENDPRGDKPLLILRRRGTTADVLRSNGTKVGCFRYYGTFTTPGTYRWYMGNCSGQNSWQLYQALGNEWGFVHFGGGQCLMFNSIRREGVYR